MSDGDQGDIRLEAWMTELPAHVKAAPFNRVAIPGSHDSMTYSVATNSPIAPDAVSPLTALYKAIPFARYLVSPFIAKWCRTQRVPLTHQLTNGVRYFDLRVAPMKLSQEIYIVHGLYGGRILEGLIQVKNFLDVNKEEVVIMDFQHFYQFEETNHESLVKLILSVFGRVLCPRKGPVADLSLDYMIKNKYQVIIIYRHAKFGQIPVFWRAEDWPTPWPNTLDPEKMISYVKYRLKTRSPSTGFIAQFVLTPDICTICKNPTSSVRELCGLPAVTAALDFLRNSDEVALNVCITDFLDSEFSEFCYLVVARNYM